MKDNDWLGPHCFTVAGFSLLLSLNSITGREICSISHCYEIYGKEKKEKSLSRLENDCFQACDVHFREETTATSASKMTRITTTTTAATKTTGISI